MKCDICGKTIEVTFMNKIVGTYYMSGKKKKIVCSNCQKMHSPEQVRGKVF